MHVQKNLRNENYYVNFRSVFSNIRYFLKTEVHFSVCNFNIFLKSMFLLSLLLPLMFYLSLSYYTFKISFHKEIHAMNTYSKYKKHYFYNFSCVLILCLLGDKFHYYHIIMLTGILKDFLNQVLLF